MHENARSITWNSFERNGELGSAFRDELSVTGDGNWRHERFLGRYGLCLALTVEAPNRKYPSQHSFRYLS
jgi:hypothetical protein